VSGISILLAAALSGALHPGADTRREIEAWLAGSSTSLSGLLVLVVPGQLAFVALALLAVLAANERPRERLGLVRGRLGPGGIVLVLLGTLFVQWAANGLASLWSAEPSQDLKDMWRMISAPQGALAVLAGLLISLGPGFCEELFFRGLAQRRLLERWPPLAAIGVTSAVFAIAHLDPQHVIGVLPLGLWLGFVAWRSGSTWTSIACHAFNNGAVFVLGRAFGNAESGDLPAGPAVWGIVAALLLGWILAVRALMRAGARSAPRSAPGR